MAFGTPLRSSTTDYINAADIASLRRELDVVINEVFSRDEGVRLGGLRSLTSVTGLSNTEQVEVVRRNNLIATVVNSRITPNMLYAEVHPKFNDYGQIPRELERGRRMEELLTMETTTLDRILQQYNLPRERRSDYLLSSSLLGSRERLGGVLIQHRDSLSDRYGLDRQHKLAILLEWLGVDLSHERFGGLGGRLGLGGSLGGGSLLNGSLDTRRGIGL